MQQSGPILVSEETSTRAIALESATYEEQPFRTMSLIPWGPDPRTRIMLFAMNLGITVGQANPPSFTADAEDSSHTI
ncbi:MAG TPA: hypothetical protein VJ180_09745, partial [Pyrinomonadaceae bacterium]|nr:hypothetical protein [Pyrinomonadaceae bacterium]